MATRLVVGCILASLSVVAPSAARAVGSVPPAGFSDEVVISGLTLPTTAQFAANGDIFVAEKSGIIKRFDGLTDASPIVVADLRTQVYNFWDKGLLGLAVDPAYPTRPYIYALYSYDAIIGGQPQKWGTPTNDGNDNCKGPPNGPGEDGCVTSGRLTRLTLNVAGDGRMTTEKELVNDWCNQFPSHSIGTVAFGNDGYLYAGGGDGASFALADVDYGQFGGKSIDQSTGQPFTPRNPCGDPPGGVGGEMSPPTAEGGSLRSQSKRRPSGPTVLGGTIIRVHPDTGAAVATNPSFDTGRDANDRRSVTYGLRNPYRFTFRPGTREIWIGDVGSGGWEEINRVIDPTATERNFGWPCYEGPIKIHAWDILDMDSCETLYADTESPATPAYYHYFHRDPIVAGDGCLSGGVLSGLAFYEGGDYPARFDDALFFTDIGRRCIWAMRAGTNGLPDPTRIETLVQDAAGPVDLQIGPGGDLFYVDHIGGTIHRIVYREDNELPVIVATATPESGPAPLEVVYDATDSFDPDGGALSFEWDLDGNGQYDPGATEPTATRTYAKGTHHPVLRVSDPDGGQRTKQFTIVSGNTPPLPFIDLPAGGTTWAVGQDINFEGHATDAEDDAVPAAGLSWQIILHHCNGTDCHVHPLTTFAGVADGSFQAPDHEFPSHLELLLTATDANGLSATVSRLLQPKATDMTFATNPSGLSLSAGGQSEQTPFVLRFIEGSTVAVSAPVQQVVDGATYNFASWSDGGARSHVIDVPAADTTYTATYELGPLADAPNACTGATSSSAHGEWLFNTLSRKTDKDWYRFNVSQKSWVRILAGGFTGNFRIDLYSSCGTLLATSNRSGLQFEEIYRKLAAGTYRVRVRHHSGGLSSTTPFGLRFTQYTGGLHILSSSGWTDSAGKLNIDGEILNNTISRRRLVQVRATFFNAAGNQIGHADASAFVNVVLGRSRVPFSVSVSKPAGYDHYTVTILSSQVTRARTVQNFAVTSSSSGLGPGLWFRGQFKNPNSFGVASIRSATTLYDEWGNVLNTRNELTDPSNVGAGGSAAYEAVFDEHFAGWNRAQVLLHGTRQ